MSELTCSCPHCGQELNVESEFAGQAVACPACNGDFAVPEAPRGHAPVIPNAPAHAPAPKFNLPGPAPAYPPAYPQHMPQYAPQHMPQQNPYRSPAANVGGPQGYGYGAAPMISPHSIQLFAQTKPWVTLFAVLGSITPALLLIMGLLVAFAGTSAGAVAEGMSSGLIMATLGAIYFLPAWRLWQYSSAIGRLRIAPSPSSLDAAIDRQRCFWKTVGIITLIGFALSLIGFFIALSAASSISS